MHNKTQAYLALFSIMLVSFMSTVGIALPYPILAPLFLSSEASALSQFMGLPPKLLLAILLATYPVGLLIGSSFIGAMSDIYGRKKTLLVSLVLSCLGYGLTIYAIVQQNFLLFALSRLMTGIFEGNSAIARAIAIDLHPTIDKTRSMAWIYAITYAGWLVGPLAGGYLMSYSPELAFYLAALAMLIAAVMVKLTIRETTSEDRQQQKTGLWRLMIKQNSFSLVRHPQLKHIFYLYLLVTMGLNAFYEFFPVWLVDKFTFNSIEIGHATAVQTLFMVLVSALLVEKIKNTFGKIKPIILGMSLLGISQLLIPLVAETVIYFYFAAVGTFIAMYNGLLPVYIADRYEQQAQGQLMGLLTSTFYLANVVIALLGGVLSLLGAQWSIVFGGLLMLLGMLYLVLFDRKVPKTSEPTSS